MKHFYIILKLAFFLLLVLGMSNSLKAQTEKIVNNYPISSTEEQSGDFTLSPSSLSILPPMWDVQLSIDVTSAVGTAGNAGAVWVGTEFWVSQWASDTIWRLDILGNYLGFSLIPGVSGTRGMSYDGTSVYMGGATGSIAVVNPITYTLTSTITLPAGITARQISYDATANGGAGGLWVANVFGSGANTNIFLVDLSGTVLLTIPQTTHTLSGIYGFAVDNYSTGGPYLWAFWQPGNPGAIISQLSLPAGTPTGVSFDVNADLGLLGIAGGIFIDTTIVPGEMSIGCLLQDDPDILTIYELDYMPLDFDLAAEDLSFNPGYTQIPISQVSPITFNGTARNKGIMSLTNSKVEIQVNSGAGLVFNDSTTIASIPSNSGTPYSFGPFTPSAIGGYDVDIFTQTDTSQVDGDSSNDNEFGTFAVTDSTMARDNGIHNGGTGYAVSATASGYALVLYDLPNADTLTSVTIELETPLQGDTTYAVVVNTVGGYPGFITDIGTVQIINGGQNVYTLKFPLGGVVLSAGTWGIGVYEGVGTTINLRQSENIYTPGTNYFQVNTTPGVWTASGIQTARFIRPNFGVAPVNVGVNEMANLEDNISIFPNPSTGKSDIYFDLDIVSDIDIKVYDNMGKTILIDKLENIIQHKYVISLTEYSNGLYFVEIETKQGGIIKKLMLSK